MSERKITAERLALDQVTHDHTGFHWRQPKEAFIDLRTLMRL